MRSDVTEDPDRRRAPNRGVNRRRNRGWLAAIVAMMPRWAGVRSGVDGRSVFGRRSERMAARHLRLHGYSIIARNFRAAGAEIDLIAMDGDTLVFVEVKARRGTSYGTPEAAVDDRKQMRIRRAAEVFTSQNSAAGVAIRFDVVAITGDGRKRKLEILRNAF